MVLRELNYAHRHENRMEILEGIWYMRRQKIDVDHLQKRVEDLLNVRAALAALRDEVSSLGLISLPTHPQRFEGTGQVQGQQFRQP